jgi:hypothetical protein
MSARPWVGRVALMLALASAAWAALTVLIGGFALDVAGVRLSSRNSLRPLLVCGVLLAGVRIALGASEFHAAIHRIVGRDRRAAAARIAGAASLAVLVFAIAWNTRAAGGSDSSCYILQADAFAHGHVMLPHPLASTLPGAAPAVFAPTGFVPSRVPPFAAVPICGAGLALTMTPLLALFGHGAVFLVVPLFATLAVWLTFVIGRRMDDEVTGATAAVLLATSPIFLYQAVQPMSDVPAAALWLAALALASRGDSRGDVGAGVCASLAVLTRPNIALLVVPLLFVLPGYVESAEAPKARRRAWRRFAVAAVPGLAAMAFLNAARYGSATASGYGSTDALFSLAHVAPNLTRYPRWIVETETPFIAVALAAPWWAARHPARGRLAMVSFAAIVLTTGTYLAYTVFDDWWYIRFLLPAIPLAIVLGVAVVLHIASRFLPGGKRVVAAAVLCLVIGAWHVEVARSRHVLDLQALESRFPVTGRYVARAMPGNAVFLAVQQSGSLRFHGARPTIAWDAIDPRALDRTIAWLSANGFRPFVALEDGEEPRFRARFAGEHFGALDWAPAAEVHAPVRVRLYDPASRAGFVTGGGGVTEYVR